MQRNAIIHGNCLEEMQKIADNSIDLIFADPPYWMRIEGILKRPEGGAFKGCNDDWDKNFIDNQDYRTFTENWLKECKRILKKDGSIWVIGSMQCIYTIGAVMQDLGFWFINDVIWHKTNPTPNFRGTRLNNAHETLIWATKSKSSKYTFHYKTAKELNTDNIEIDLFEKGHRKQMGSIWRFAVCNGKERLKTKDGEKLHSTQKPEALLYRIIALTSNIGDLVLDPFGGTMTTATVAKMLGRDYLSIEQDLNYVIAGRLRVNNAKFIEDDIALASFDEKPIKAPMPEMIKAGFFTVGEKFYLKQSNQTAQLTEDGKLLYDAQIYDMHSLAAKIKAVSADRLNGFNCWQVIRNNSLIGIDAVRENYRVTKKPR